ncbi:MYB DNA-binding domain protein [Macrophomina phaseolina MS6]|uniref:MYB DNA-binding domain protein n=1 Tax=Macrophomina phaseolina (strain MS6) TaxID=1126212 RepID=K2S3W6_MACPH|nr:MYB DNA-binding domain protein [Macrophomina phaseolina MS6]
MAAAPQSSSTAESIYAQVDNYPWDTDAEFQSGLGAILGSTASQDQAVELALRARCFYYSRKLPYMVKLQLHFGHWLQQLQSVEPEAATNSFESLSTSPVHQLTPASKYNAPVDFDAYKAYRATAPSPSPVPTTATNGLTPASLPAMPSPGQTPPLGSTATFPAATNAAAPTSTPAAAAPPPPPSGQQQQQQEEAPYPTSFAHIVELITTGQPIPGIKEIPDTVLEGQGSASTASKRKKPWEKDIGVAAGAEAAQQTVTAASPSQ